MTKIKEFFNNPKGIFVGITVLMWLATFGVVISGNLEFSTALTSLGGITAGVVALYQWYTKTTKITKLNRNIESIDIKSKLLEVKNNRLSKDNSTLRKKLK